MNFHSDSEPYLWRGVRHVEDIEVSTLSLFAEETDPTWNMHVKDKNNADICWYVYFHCLKMLCHN